MSIRQIPIAVRAHTEPIRDEKHVPHKTKQEDLRKSYGKRILVFDTETTTCIYQNMLCGQAMIAEGTTQAHIDGLVSEHYLIYGDNLTESNMVILEEFADQRKANLVSRQEFIENVFLPELWELGTLCIGFNLPFDLSRLAMSSRTFCTGKHKDMFELKLSKSDYKPTILIKPIDSKKAFIQFRFLECPPILVPVSMLENR